MASIAQYCKVDDNELEIERLPGDNANSGSGTVVFRGKINNSIKISIIFKNINFFHTITTFSN